MEDVEEDTTVDEIGMLELEEVTSGDVDGCRAEDEIITLLLDVELGNIGGVEEITGELEGNPTWTELLCILLDPAMLLVAAKLEEMAALLTGFD